MDDAHSKVEIVLNEDEENEEEKRFNEIICYDSGDSDGESNEFERSDTTATNSEISSSSSLINQGQNTTFDALDSDNVFGIDKPMKKLHRSNAAQMRKYRARQRTDPERYRQYLERERMRNYKRKYEQRIQAAQEKAQALGIPYVVIEPPNARRGRKPKSSGVSLVLPSHFDGFDIEDKSLWVDSGDKHTAIPKIELKKSDNQERNAQISVVNINKLITQPRSALQTLLPQEVNDRERISNSIKMEHDYVMQEQLSVHSRKTRRQSGKSEYKRDKHELLALQLQCRSFISKSKLSKRNGQYQRKEQSQRNERNRIESVEHEDLDDLFKELAEVANMKPPKMRHASTHKSLLCDRSTPRKSFFEEVDPRRTGEFSLTVSMPVKPIATARLKGGKIKEEPKSSAMSRCNDDEDYMYKCNSTPKDKCWPTLGENGVDDVNANNINSIEIKQEPLYADDAFF